MVQPAQWRIIPYLEAPGAVQMAIDAWLLAQHQQGQQPPTLRFHRWQPAAVSVGYFQRQLPPHWSTLQWQNHPVPLVRRPTGGRAVLHQGDLVYSLVCSPQAGGRSATYRHLCEFLIQGWEQLGLTLHYGQRGRAYAHATNCFALATGADLVDQKGRKIIGSAQRYSQQSVLQHGSIRLQPDPALFRQVFATEAPSLPLVVQEASSPQLIQALTAAAQAHFAMVGQVQPLTASEWESIQPLVATYDLGSTAQAWPPP